MSDNVQVKGRIPEDLKDEWKNSLPDGQTMSDRMEELIAGDLARLAEPVEDEDDQRDLPPEGVERDGYLAMWRHADTGNRISKGHAETVVAEATRIKKQLVRKAVLDRLQQDGFISYQWGSISVKPPEKER